MKFEEYWNNQLKRFQKEGITAPFLIKILKKETKKAFNADNTEWIDPEKTKPGVHCHYYVFRHDKVVGKMIYDEDENKWFYDYNERDSYIPIKGTMYTETKKPEAPK